MLTSGNVKCGQAWLGDPTVKDLCKCSITEQHPLKMQGEKERLPQFSYCVSYYINSPWGIFRGFSNWQTRKTRPLLQKSRDLLHKNLPRAAVTLKGELAYVLPLFLQPGANAGWWQHSVSHKMELATPFSEGIKNWGPVQICSFRNKLQGKRDWEI